MKDVSISQRSLRIVWLTIIVCVFFGWFISTTSLRDLFLGYGMILWVIAFILAYFAITAKKEVRREAQK